MGFLGDSAKRRHQMMTQRFMEAQAQCGKPLVFSHCSALRFWGAPAKKGKAEEEEEMKRMVLDVVVSEAKKVNRHIRAVKMHVWKAATEEWPAPDLGFAVCKPAAAWAQSASQLNLDLLAMSGAWLVSGDEALRRCFKADLEQYVRDNPRFHGRAKCLEALKLIVENTASPPESELHMLLIRHGVSDGKANYEVTLSNERLVRIDVAFPDIKLALEYQGRYHETPGQAQDDEARRRDLERDGWKVMFIYAKEMASEGAKERLMEEIFGAMEDQKALARVMRMFGEMRG